MSPNPLVFVPSPRAVAAELATPWTCPALVVIDTDGTLRDLRGRLLGHVDLALFTNLPPATTLEA